MRTHREELDASFYTASTVSRHQQYELETTWSDTVYQIKSELLQKALRPRQ
jgi:hypothetical protein